jgi:hypothetical protein
MQTELLEQLYRQQDMDNLLQESDYTVRRRKELVEGERDC